MITLKNILPAILCAALGSTAVFPAEWKPRPGWRDSYAVDGICYCDSSNFDHGIGDKQVLTPDGFSRSVRQICADIKNRFGSGEVQGRIPFNTIACGNPPANDAPDEHLSDGCPGRVDIGPAGCFQIGPDWPLGRLYGTPMVSVDRSRWAIKTFANRKNAAAMVDGSLSTRWTTGAPQQPGQWIEVDLGEDYLINRIIMDSSGSRNDFPRGWSITKQLENGTVEPIEATLEFTGEITSLVLPDTTLRRLRITQTGVHQRWYWSVHELHVGYVASSN